MLTLSNGDTKTLKSIPYEEYIIPVLSYDLVLDFNPSDKEPHYKRVNEIYNAPDDVAHLEKFTRILYDKQAILSLGKGKNNRYELNLDFGSNFKTITPSMTSFNENGILETFPYMSFADYIFYQPHPIVYEIRLERTTRFITLVYIAFAPGDLPKQDTQWLKTFQRILKIDSFA